MTLSLKHAFQSAKADGGDTTLLRPSDWNAEHSITLATDKLIGRASAGTGAAEEISCTSVGRAILAKATVDEIISYLGLSAATTGDVKLTLKTSADSGWVMFNDGTIGGVSSGASTRANADCQALFTLLFNNIDDASAPLFQSNGVATTRGAQSNAATAWSNSCRVSLTKTLGRALAIAGSGAGLTSRALGVTTGAETHQLSAGEMPAHTHTASVTDPGHTHTYDRNGGFPASSGGISTDGNTQSATNTGSATTGISVSNANTGGGGAHNNMQPTAFLNAMVKL